ncbi:hypothetical protein CLV42_12548 [Chitinophaga ginsengisoli]|uniref:Uncharacterized protein n=1 Tax=Chitinophaga ginsengisoli TaxID=363837 RepID=A0A2P8FF47_9BACT|nr:hypothetical protein CLV42_12548 [Chitinophaga ginsengisoli]
MNKVLYFYIVVLRTILLRKFQACCSKLLSYFSASFVNETIFESFLSYPLRNCFLSSNKTLSNLKPTNTNLSNA